MATAAVQGGGRGGGEGARNSALQEKVGRSLLTAKLSGPAAAVAAAMAVEEGVTTFFTGSQRNNASSTRHSQNPQQNLETQRSTRPEVWFPRLTVPPKDREGRSGQATISFSNTGGQMLSRAASAPVVSHSALEELVDWETDPNGGWLSSFP